MARALILGTAGHIDHGKTALVKALTGTDCDRLPEEKARGITIDIGFARLDLGDFRIGIVDLPGHERFIMNMLAGATGVDLALLVVAADDSVMPQTREHLEILRLLGLTHGVIALTKADLVDETTRAVVEMEIRELVQGSFLEQAPIVATSIHTGAGLQELRDALATACAQVEEKRTGDWFRLAIDRSFVVQGHGTIVTGTVTSGQVSEGDELEWLPSRQRVRVRGLHHHDQKVSQVHRGMRAALNLAGVPHEEVVRGQELASPGVLEPSRVITVRLYCLPGATRPIKHRATVRFHVGTSALTAKLALLDCDALEPGAWGLAQLFLSAPAVTVWGQPFIVRDTSATFTLGGGQVLQPVARKVRRRHTEVLARIEQLWSGDASQRVLTSAWMSGFNGLAPIDLVRGTGIQLGEAQELVQELFNQGKLVEAAVHAANPRFLHADLFVDLEQRVMQILDAAHRDTPLLSAHLRQRIVQQLDYIGNDALVQQAIGRLLAANRVVGDQQRIALADFKPKLSANLRKLRDKIIDEHQRARFTPPERASFVGAAGGNAGSLQDLFDVCVAEGYLCKIGADVYLHAEAEADMTRLVQHALSQGKGLTVAEIRDLLGTTRKFAIPICEYLDRVGLTQRRGDLRFGAGRTEAPPPGE
jgi:selenocysteine-specific elongation factor